MCVRAYMCACVCGKVMRGRRHDWWHWGVIVIESITPYCTAAYVGVIHTHTHTYTFIGSPMGHSDTVQIKKQTDGYVDHWKERKKGRVCVCACAWV